MPDIKSQQKPALIRRILIMKPVLSILAIGLFCSCVPALDPEARHVELIFNPTVAMQGEKIGEVIDSAGHWYNYLFLSNPAMIEGAINDLRNNAHLLGSDRVYIYRHVDFTTSVTILGEAYINKPLK